VVIVWESERESAQHVTDRVDEGDTNKEKHWAWRGRVTAVRNDSNLLIVIPLGIGIQLYRRSARLRHSMPSGHGVTLTCMHLQRCIPTSTLIKRIPNPDLQCYAESENPSACALLREDYLECLHHSKEVRTRFQVYFNFISPATPILTKWSTYEPRYA